MLYDGVLSCLGTINGSPFSPNGTNQNRDCYFAPKFIMRFATTNGEHEHLFCGHHARFHRKFSNVIALAEFVGPLVDAATYNKVTA